MFELSIIAYGNFEHNNTLMKQKWIKEKANLLLTVLLNHDTIIRS